MNRGLVRFYEGTGTDHRGRTLADILRWNDDRLEGVHDYIQWLFPLSTASAFNPDAPLLDEETIRVFHGSPMLRRKLVDAFVRLLGFYGFTFRLAPAGPVVTMASEATVRMWMTPGNHNFLRITRILTSLRTLGCWTEARAFLVALEKLYPRYRAAIGDSIHFWRGVMKGA